MPDDPRLHNQGPRADNPAQRDKDRQQAGLPVERAWKEDPTMAPVDEAPQPDAVPDGSTSKDQ